MKLFTTRFFQLGLPLLGMFGAHFIGLWIAGVCGIIWVFYCLLQWKGIFK